MEALTLLLHGFAVLLTWKTLALMLVGLLLGIFVKGGAPYATTVMTGILLGVVFGIVWALIGYLATRGKRLATSPNGVSG